MQKKLSLRSLAKNLSGLYIFLCATVSPLYAQTASMSQGQAAGYTAGTDLNNSTANSINGNTANNTIPGYSTNTTPSNLTNYMGGATLGAAGSDRNAHCDAQGMNMAGGSGAQECNVSIILRTNTNKGSFAAGDDITKTAPFDSSLIGSGTKNRICTVVETTNPAETQIQTCNDYYHSYTSSCNATLNPQCTYASAPIRNLSTSGSIPTSINEVGTGTYNYSMNTDYQCEAVYGQSISFNIDAPNKGSYITVSSQALDDSAVIALNGIVVYYGHPNSGGQWQYPSFGTSPGFQFGYLSNLDICDPFDATNCITYTSDFKLSDSCTMGSPGSIIDSSSRTGTPAIWCSPDGKLVGKFVEGKDFRTIDVSNTLPIRKGQNTIEFYWGTELTRACGGSAISGQIHNVAASCSGWTDNCSAQKGLLQ